MHHSLNRTSPELLQLTTAERLFIWGFRAIAQCARLRWPAVADIRHVYDHFHAGDAVPSLEALHETFACTAHTSIELHCPGCRGISPSELDLLRAVSAVQRRRIDAARAEFERWLPPVGADWAMAPAEGLATIFRIVGLELPDRPAHASDDDRMAALRSWPLGTATLH
jgi:hypothetical protein